MKRCIADLPMVTAPRPNEEMIIYLCAAREAVSAVLLTERDSQQMSIYFVSHALQAPEINYSSMEKLVLALVHVSRRLRRYFQVHPIAVITDQPRTSIHGQVLADFIAERPDEDGPLIEIQDGPRYGLHLNVDKTELFWPKEDPRSRLEGIFPHNISRPLHGVKLLGGPVSVDVDFGSALVMKRVSKTIGLLDAVAKINDPQCELLLIRACAGVSKLYFTMRTCPPRVFDMALRSALERIVTASGSGFGDWQWRLATLPFAFGGLGIYSAGDVLNYAFIASRLQSATLQTKLLRDMACAIYKGGSHFRRLRVVPFSGLGQTMNVRLYRLFCVTVRRPLIFLSPSLVSACSRFFIEDVLMGINANHVLGLSGLRAPSQMFREPFSDIFFDRVFQQERKLISDLNGVDKQIRPADMLLYLVGLGGLECVCRI
ncbi:hypothetical protein Tco_0649794 [Tanacetum coccineum]